MGVAGWFDGLSYSVHCSSLFGLASFNLKEIQMETLGRVEDRWVCTLTLFRVSSLAGLLISEHMAA